MVNILDCFVKLLLYFDIEKMIAKHLLSLPPSVPFLSPYPSPLNNYLIASESEISEDVQLGNNSQLREYISAYLPFAIFKKAFSIDAVLQW
jgi:hypothetical protein